MSSSSDDMIKAATASDNSVNSSCKKKMSIIPKFFGSKRNGRESSDEDMFQADGHIRDSNTKITPRKKAFLEGSLVAKKNLTERHSSPEIVGLNLSEFGEKMAPKTVIQDIRVFVATWNVGGKTPSHGLNLEDFLQVEGSSDLYILGFQEIVPLSAGNVLVVEDNEPAARWLTLINQALNKPQNDSTHSSSDSNSKQQNESKSNFFHKPSLKVLSRNLRADSRLLKACNCPPDSPLLRPRKLSNDPFIDEFLSVSQITPSPKRLSYNLIASKQMVGIFLSVWARNELVRHIGHLRISCVGRGIMGCLGNKGCIAVSLSVHQTSFCFVCSHLASGEKEGDEIKRNADVNEIMKSTEFSKVCKDPNSRIPEKINDHDRIMWLGDLNYRVALSYEKTRILLEDNDWDSLLQMDQLNIEREAGRVFSGWDEGKIFFAPTYKYSHNSDSYAGETIKSKKKRRTPAWCDRILWRGNGIEQLSYIRGESRFSDHRPVCAVFAVEVEMVRNRTTKCCNGYTFGGKRLLFEDCIPQRHSFYE